MSSSFLSVLIQRQAGKYGDRVALRYRDYKTKHGFRFLGTSLPQL